MNKRHITAPNTSTQQYYLTADYITQPQLGKTATLTTVNYNVLSSGRTIVDHDITRHYANRYY